MTNDKQSFTEQMEDLFETHFEQAKRERAQRLEDLLDTGSRAGWFKWARSQFNWPLQRCNEVSDTFRDYWRAQPGQKGLKADWEATWRTWCRREGQFQKQAQSKPGEFKIPYSTPEKSAADREDVVRFDEFLRLSRRYPRLREHEVWALVGKSEAEIAAMVTTS